MNYNVLRKEIQDYIQENLHKSVSQFALKKSNFTDVTHAELVQQFQGKKIAQQKFPIILNFNDFYFPKHLHLEQASSEFTANYKRKLVNGNSFIDVTSGMGIDLLVLSNSFEKCTYVEPNKELYELTKHNFSILGKDHKTRFHLSTCEDFLQQNSAHFDVLYIDPSRRIQSKKVFLIEDLEPNLLEIQDELHEISGKVMIKLSPIIDLQQCVEKIKYISEIHLISYKNELKEVVLICDSSNCDEITVHCVELSNDKTLQFSYSKIRETELSSYSEVQKFLYIPNVSLLKSGAFNFISKQYNIEKLHPNSHVYTSELYIEHFLGSVYEVFDSQFDFKKHKGETYNVICKNFPMKEEELKKKYNLTFGGTNFVLCFKSLKKNNTILTKKIIT